MKNSRKQTKCLIPVEFTAWNQAQFQNLCGGFNSHNSGSIKEVACAAIKPKQRQLPCGKLWAQAQWTHRPANPPRVLIHLPTVQVCDQKIEFDWTHQVTQRDCLHLSRARCLHFEQCTATCAACTQLYTHATVLAPSRPSGPGTFFLSMCLSSWLIFRPQYSYTNTWSAVPSNSSTNYLLPETQHNTLHI